ncbi:rRNA-processing protein [Tilletia horrida]|uniref:rRNA-processing protein n=1 Tax=Tilletia horrida TaxID=155126 RepID=A0AAN6GVL7_9BASI|nr:rRNA-processing protein [Tilletia horrida]
MISSAVWIARGKSARNPQKYSVDDSELERVSAYTGLQLEEAKAQLERAQRIQQNGGEEGEDDWEDDADDNEEDDQDDEDDDDDEMKADADTDAKLEKEDPNDLSKYNLDDYDNEESNPVSLGPFSNIKGLSFYQSNDDDPYITLKGDDAAAEDDEEEREELEILPEDNLVVCAKTEEEISQLEAYLYAESDANLFVHHDLLLPTFPLCLEWLDYHPAAPVSSDSADQNSSSSNHKATGAQGSYIAVGTMDPEIEIWDMDVVEGLFPNAILGRKDLTESLNAPLGTGKKKRRQTQPRVAVPTHHVDAVLSLSWNRTVRNLLASASADHTVKLWDLSRAPTAAGKDDVLHGTEAIRSFSLHQDKVQCVAWNTSGSALSGHEAAGMASVLLTGGYDRTLRVFDTRAPDAGVVAHVGADVEAIRWNPWREHEFYVSLENGLVQSFDARTLSTAKAAATLSHPKQKGVSSMTTTPVFTLSAHDGGCTSLDISPHIPGCMITGGMDKKVKLWNLEGVEDASAASGKPSSVSLTLGRDLDAGKIFTVSFSPDTPLTFAAGGSGGVLRIFDPLSNSGVRKTYEARLNKYLSQERQAALADKKAGDGLVKMSDEDFDEEEEEDDEPASEAARAAYFASADAGEEDVKMDEA